MSEHPHITDVLVRAEARYQRASTRADLLRAERDAAIRRAIVEGMSHAAIYRALDGAISRARIGQIALEGEEPCRCSGGNYHLAACGGTC